MIKKMLLLLLLLSPAIVSAYAVRYNHPTINQTEINNILNTIPKERLEGIKIVRFYYCLGQYWDGLYIVGGIIYVDTCYGGVYDILEHELQHNYCWLKDKDLSHNRYCFSSSRN